MKPADIENSTRPLYEQAFKLEKEAKELRALAKEVEDKLRKISGSSEPLLESEINNTTLDHLRAAIRKKGGRVNHYAERLNTTEERIRELIEQSEGIITIGPKGWIMMEEVL